MNFLGIDYGDKRIGIALAQEGWIKPLDTIENTSSQKVIEKIKNIIKENNIDQVVFGLPKPLKGGKNERLEITKNFGKQLKQEVSVPLEFSSEIFTSKLANRSSYTKKQTQQVDARAACFILQNYLKKIKNES